MLVLPALTTLISLGFAAQVLNQYRTRSKPYQLAWGLALLFYAIAASAEVLGSISGWNDFDFRIYYLFGGILLVPWLALGSALLLLQGARARWARVGYIGFVVLVTVVGLVAIATAGLHDSFINGTRIPDNCAMYCPREHGYAFGNVLAVVAAAVGNVVGTVVLAGGAGYSAYRTWRAGLHRNLTIGNILILAGALVVAAIASLTRIGYYELFYAGQAAGVAIIFAGFLVIASVTRPRTQLA
jgi:hypothetical protein